MDKPGVQRKVTRLGRESKNYQLGKKLTTIVWRKKTEEYASVLTNLGILLQEQEQTAGGTFSSAIESWRGLSQCCKLFVSGNFQKVFGWSFVSKTVDEILHYWEVCLVKKVYSSLHWKESASGMCLLFWNTQHTSKLLSEIFSSWMLVYMPSAYWKYMNFVYKQSAMASLSKVEPNFSSIHF